jgi:hypothetical protein
MLDLLNRFIDFEVSEGLGDTGAGEAPAPDVQAGADPAPAGDPGTAADPEGSPSSGEPAAPAWTGPSAEEWQETQQLLRTMAERQEPQAPATDPAGEMEQLVEILENARLEGDVRTEVAVMQELQRRALAETLAPYTPALADVEKNQAKETVTGWLNDLKVPEADHEDVVFFAHGFVPRDQEGRPLSGHAQQATQQAAERLAARDARVGQAAVEAYKAELEKLSGAPADVGGATAATDAPVDAADEMAVARMHIERRRLGLTA